MVSPVWDLLDGEYFGTYVIKIRPDNIPFGDGEMKMRNVINPTNGRLVFTLVFTSGLVSTALTDQIVLPLNIHKTTFSVILERDDPIAGAVKLVITEAGALSFETILTSDLFAG